MQHTLDLISELRTRLQAFNQNLDLKVRNLIREGLLTPRDKEKLDINAQATLDALSRFMQNASYNEVVKEELLLNLVKDYEKEATELVSAIEQRRYSERFLLDRIDRIKQQALNELTLPDVKKDAEPKLKRLESQLKDDMHVILRKVSHKPQLLETLFREFEHDVMEALRLSLPQKH